VDNLAEARDADVLDVNGCVVLPGLVDARLHVPASMLTARRALELAFAHGSTAVGACGSYLGLRALAGAAPVPPVLIPSLDIDPAFDDGQLNRAVRRQLGAFLRLDPLTHTREALRLFLSTGVPLRAVCGERIRHDWLGLALAYGVSAVELDQPLDRSQIALLADSPVSAVVTPATSGSLRKLLDGDVALALGSGFGIGNDTTCSMLAAALSVVRHGGADIAEALTMATVNAAYVLGAGQSCGSLEAGKRADVLVLHLSDYRDLPAFTGVNVVSKIVQAGTLVS